MLNTFKYALAAVSTVIAGGYVAQQADAPAQKSQVPMQFASFTTDQDLNRKVSLNINGTFGDVLKWLKSQNIDFVIADEGASKRRIAVNMQNKPLREVLDAVAAAMGGSWNVENNTFVYQPGGRSMFFNQVPGLPSMPDMKNFKWDSPDVKVFSGKDMKEFKVDGKDMKFWVDGKEMDWKELEKSGKFKVFSGEDMKGFMKDFKGPDFKEFKNFKDLEKNGNYKLFSGDDLKELKGFEFFGDGKDGKDIRVWVNGKEVTPRELQGKGGVQFFHEGQMDEKTRKQVEEAMSKARKELEMYRSKNGGKAFSGEHQKEIEAAMKKAHEAMSESMKHFDKQKIEEMIAKAQKEGGEHRKLSDQERKEVEAAMKGAQKAMEEARKQMNDPKIKAEIERAMKAGKLSDKERREMEIDMKRAHEEMAKAKIDMSKAHKEMEHARLQGDNMKKLLDSLTPAQWELSKKQGYLKLSDLTAAQRMLIGDIKPSDDLTLSYSIDGKKITIKGK